VNEGFLPPGATAIDLAHALGLPLYDPDSQIVNDKGVRMFELVDPTIGRPTAKVLQRPASGNGLIGGTGRLDPLDALAIITSNSIYVPYNSRDRVIQIVAALAQLDYVGSIFVNDRFGEVPGSLPMSAAGLIGAAKLPVPAISLSFRTFPLDPKNPAMTNVLVGGVTQQQGQGTHGQLSRADTFNNMSAIGPDFKKQFLDGAPVGNADVAPTLAFIMRLKLSAIGSLHGRVLREALIGGPASVRFEKKVARSKPAASGKTTVLMYQQAGAERYLDQACFTAASQPCE